jgi:c-di-GMP-related signal transduction protein
MVGVISLMPSVFGVPIDEITAPLNLPDDVHEALCGREGTLGKLLELAENSEGEGIANSGALMSMLGIGASALNLAQTDAIAWATRIDSENGAA